jgi:hypothetical protein
VHFPLIDARPGVHWTGSHFVKSKSRDQFRVSQKMMTRRSMTRCCRATVRDRSRIENAKLGTDLLLFQRRTGSTVHYYDIDFSRHHLLSFSKLDDSHTPRIAD